MHLPTRTLPLGYRRRRLRLLSLASLACLISLAPVHPSLLDPTAAEAAALSLSAPRTPGDATPPLPASTQGAHTEAAKAKASPQPYPTRGISAGPGAAAPAYAATFVSDISIPDGMVLAPGARFTKTWEIQNTGSATWGAGYSWRFEAGAPLGPVRRLAVPVVRPNGRVRFSVPMVAPRRDGRYRGYWQMTGPSDEVFGMQAWVAIQIGSGRPASTPTPIPLTPNPIRTATPIAATPPASRAPATVAPAAISTATTVTIPTATAAPTRMAPPMATRVAPPTATRVAPPTATRVAPPTARSIATAMATATATPAVAAPPAWFGPAVGRAFFAEGYTGGRYQEYLSLLNPSDHEIRARVTVYRADGATRLLSLRMAALSRRTLDLNLLVPKASIALRVDADGTIVVERALYDGNGHIVAGTPLPSRHWYVAEGYVSGRFADGLRIFNPYDLAATVTINASSSDGALLTSHRVVPGNGRIMVGLDDIAPIGQSALHLDSTMPVVVESVVRATGAMGPGAAMALDAPSPRWYFPDGGTSRGNREFIAVFNPHQAPTDVSLSLATGNGIRRVAVLRVGPGSRDVFVVHDLIRQPGLAAVVSSRLSVVAQEVRYSDGGGVSLSDGAPRAARRWALAEGYCGAGFQEWITLLNPTAHAATVRVRLIGRHGLARSLTVYEPAYHHDYLYVNGRLPNGPVATILDANSPIVAGRTLIFNRGTGLSTTTAVALTSG